MRRLLLAALVAVGLSVMLGAQEYYPSARNLIGMMTTTVDGIAATSTDGFILQNTTASTAGVPVQMSPRSWWRGTAWDTAASQTVGFFAETLTLTSATPTGTWRLGYSLNGAAPSFPLQVQSSGTVQAPTFAPQTSVVMASAVPVYWTSRTMLRSNADGTLQLTNNAQTIGVQLKVDALPTPGTCGTSPAVTAGSTPLAGSVNVGTGGTATSCTVNFNGTAFPSAPFCVVTTSLTNAVTRATATTTVLTLTSTTAWTASDIVTWHCISPRA